MNTQLLAFFGPISSGKSTCAKRITETCPDFRLWRVAPFAGPIKGMLRSLGLTDRQLYSDQKQVPSELLCGTTPRKAMQTLGTEWGRDMIHPDFWVRVWENQIRALWGREARTSTNPHTTTGIVVDDLRFENEEKAIRKLGGKIIRVSRPDIDLSDDHASERSHSFKADYTITNAGALSDLYEEIDLMTKRL